MRIWKARTKVFISSAMEAALPTPCPMHLPAACMWQEESRKLYKLLFTRIMKMDLPNQ